MARRETEYEDIEDLDGDDQLPGDMDDDMPEMGDFPNLFWHCQLKPDGETDLEPPAVDGFVIHITKACFGPNVKQGSRTVVVTKDDDKNEVPVCVLLEGKNESESLHLIISDGLTFQLKGKNPSAVSLTGYIAPPPHPSGDDGALSMDDEEMGDIDNMDDMPELKEHLKKRKFPQTREEDEEAPELDDEDQKDAIEPPNKRAKIDNKNKPQPPKNANNNTNPNANKKNQNQNQNANPNNNNNNNNVTSPTTDDKEKPLSKAQKKKQKKAAAKNAAAATTTTTVTTTVVENTKNDTNEKEKNDNDKYNNDNDNKNDNEDKGSNEKKSPKNTPNQSPKDAPINKKTDDKKMMSMKNGIQYKDIRPGNGQVIKPGQKVSVYYVGQLDDSSIFDKSINGEGFEFTFGKGEVIKGWDEGMKGMKVGGKRRIVVPSNLAYGKEGTDSIPADAQLTFTVEVRKVE